MVKLLNNFLFISLILICGASICLSQEVKPKFDADEINNLPIQVKVTGERLKAISVALDAFKNEGLINPRKRRVENYEITVQENKDYFFILFLANRTQEELRSFGGGSVAGTDIMYFITREDYKIIYRSLFK